MDKKIAGRRFDHESRDHGFVVNDLVIGLEHVVTLLLRSVAEIEISSRQVPSIRTASEQASPSLHQVIIVPPCFLHDKAFSWTCLMIVSLLAAFQRLSHFHS